MRKRIKGKKRRKSYAWFGLSGFLLFAGFFMAPAMSGKVQAGEAKAYTDQIFQVLFPTNTEHVFDFIMDPQELILQTHAAAYGNLSFEEGATLFFRRYEEGAGVDYSSSSDALVITNMGRADVEIVVTASISPDSLGAIAMTDDGTFEEDTRASLYLALTDGEQRVPIDGESGAMISAILTGLEENGEPREYRFWLEGAVNRNGDWSEIGGADPRVTVTWSTATMKEELEEEQTIKEEGILPDGKELEGKPEGEELQETPEEEKNLTETGTTETKKDVEKQETSGNQGNAGKPEEPGTTENPGESEAPGVQENPEESVVPGNMENPGKPEGPGAVEDFGKTETPGAQENSEKPEGSGAPKDSGKSEMSGTPENQEKRTEDKIKELRTGGPQTP